MADELRLRRGLDADQPSLLEGEPGFTTDTKEFLIGTSGGNLKMNGSTVLSGAADPSTEGVDGDFYINTTTWTIFGPKATTWPSGVLLVGADGVDGDDGLKGDDGADGNTVLSGIVDPVTEGVDGDFYINTASSYIFGPKAAGSWPSGVSLVGAAGTDGDDGADGTDGKTLLSGTVDPAAGDGVDGDFYINTTSSTIFGPKASGTWPSGVSLVGADGVDGDDGLDGTDGQTLLNGTADPSTEGTDGDFYIQTTDWEIFGPKASGSWPSGVAIEGADGADGSDGNSILSGTVDPAAGDGVDGDFYINTTSWQIFGPKAAGSWPSGVDIVGADGADGEGVIAGGTINQLLAKASATDYDTQWVDAPAASNGVPAGGTTGQRLAKASDTDYDQEWVDDDEAAGDVVGPSADPVDSNVVEFDGTTGTLIKDSGVTHASLALAVVHRLTDGTTDHAQVATNKTASEFNTVTTRNGFSSMLITGGDLSEATLDSAKLKVSSITGILRTAAVATGVFEYVTLVVQDEIIIPIADTLYRVIFTYGSPCTITLATAQPNGFNAISIGTVMKTATGVVHWNQGGFRLADGPGKTHKRLKATHGLAVTSGGAITEKNTLEFDMAAATAWAGLNELTTSAFDSAVDKFTYCWRETGDWTYAVDQTALDSDSFDDNSVGGPGGTVAPNQYGCHWVYLHPSMDGVFIVYGRASYTLSDAQIAQPPTDLPVLLSGFAALLAKVIVKRDDTDFTEIEYDTDTTFSGQTVPLHNDLGGLDVDDYQHLTAAEMTSVTDHLANLTKHRLINDASTLTTELFSASELITRLATKIGAAGVTFENLDTNSDVGTGSAQVAAGDHEHTAVPMGLGGSMGDGSAAIATATKVPIICYDAGSITKWWAMDGLGESNSITVQVWYNATAVPTVSDLKFTITLAADDLANGTPTALTVAAGGNILLVATGTPSTKLLSVTLTGTRTVA